MIREIEKRTLDLILVISGLLILLPFLICIAVAIRFKLGVPVFFRQDRTGINGKPFKLYKFRTMTHSRDNEGNLLPDEKRLTSFGRFLRATSLDELPEFFNVLKGDMSIVGPRPLLPEYIPLYTKEQNRRHEVKPGITGWAQVNGRNAISWEEKFKLDVWYVDHQSFWLDMKILFLTMVKVFKREGIDQSEQITMKKFNGDSK